MVKYSPVRKLPAGIRSEYFFINESIPSMGSAFAWAEAMGRIKVYYSELTAMQVASDSHLVNLSLLRLPADYVSAYAGDYIHGMMMRSYSNFRSSPEFPLASEFPNNLVLQKGEALVLHLSNSTPDSVALSAELGIYYTGGLFMALDEL